MENAEKTASREVVMALLKVLGYDLISGYVNMSDDSLLLIIQEDYTSPTESVETVGCSTYTVLSSINVLNCD